MTRPTSIIAVSALTFLLVGLVTGCTNDGYPLDNTYHVQGKAPSSTPQPSTFAYRYPDSPPVLNEKGLKQLVEQYRQRVVLLDFWATWSHSNREEMRMLARLQDDLRDEGFQVIACSFDEPIKWSKTIVPILHDAQARFPCVIIPQENRMDVRMWLEPGWNYEVPARFVIGRDGQVVLTAMTDVPLAGIEQQVRELVLHGTGGGGHVGTIAQAAQARGKLINIKTGSFDSLPDLSSLSDPRRIAEQMADQIAQRIDPEKNPRIAILPFPKSMGQRSSDPEGERTAELVEEALRERGFVNIVRPAQAEKLMNGAGLSATSIEFEPAMARDVLHCDYVVVGYVRPGAVKKTIEIPPPKPRIVPQEEPMPPEEGIEEEDPDPQSHVFRDPNDCDD